MKNYKQYIFVVLALCLFSACDKNNGAENLFDETASQRLDARTEELKSKLLATENGWKMTYFTDAEEFGGFLFLMRFNEDGTVVMTSDTDDDISVATSSYDFKLGNTVKLSFTTKNDIHNLSDAGFKAELRGEGYKGSGEFYYIGEDESGNLIFTSVRGTGEEDKEEKIIFEKATAEDWNSTIQNSIQMESNFVGGPDASMFKSLIIDNKGKETAYPYSFSELKRFVSFSMEEDSTVVDKSFGLSYSSEGFVIYPPLEVEGESFEVFTYDENENRFYSKQNDVTVYIGSSDTPAVVGDDANDIGTIDYGIFGHRVEWGTNAYTSAGFDALLEQVAKNLGTTFKFERIEFNTVPNEQGLVNLYVRVSGYWARYTFTPEVKDGIIYFKYQGAVGGNATYFETALQPLIDFFGSEKGLYYEHLGSYSSSAVNYSNSSGAFTSLDNPSQRLYILWY